MKKGNNLSYYLVILVFLLLVFSISSIFFLKDKIIDKKTLEIRFNITNKVGFDLNSSLLNFGNVVLGSSSNRDVIISNNYNRICFHFYF